MSGIISVWSRDEGSSLLQDGRRVSSGSQGSPRSPALPPRGGTKVFGRVVCTKVVAVEL